MAEATLDQGDVMRTADGTPLKISIARAMRRNKLMALALIAPLFLFILFSFLIPIVDCRTPSRRWKTGTAKACRPRRPSPPWPPT